MDRPIAGRIWHVSREARHRFTMEYHWSQIHPKVFIISEYFTIGCKLCKGRGVTWCQFICGTRKDGAHKTLRWCRRWRGSCASCVGQGEDFNMAPVDFSTHTHTPLVTVLAGIWCAPRWALAAMEPLCEGGAWLCQSRYQRLTTGMRPLYPSYSARHTNLVPSKSYPSKANSQ